MKIFYDEKDRCFYGFFELFKDIPENTLGCVIDEIKNQLKNTGQCKRGASVGVFMARNHIVYKAAFYHNKQGGTKNVAFNINFMDDKLKEVLDEDLPLALGIYAKGWRA